METHPQWVKEEAGTRRGVAVLVVFPCLVISCTRGGCSVLSATRRGHTTDFEEGGAPVWMELDGTLSGLSLSTYSSSSPPEQLPRKPEGVVSFCSSAARFFRFRALELGILMPLTEEVVAQPVGIGTVPSLYASTPGSPATLARWRALQVDRRWERKVTQKLEEAQVTK